MRSGHTRRKYNDAMFVVRYTALVALVVWLSVLLGDSARSVERLGIICGAVIFICLFVMKFVGPPPHAFIPRAAIVAAMLAVAIGARAGAVADARVPMAIDAALGLVL